MIQLLQRKGSNLFNFLKGTFLVLTGVFALFGAAGVAKVTGHPAAANFLTEQGDKLGLTYQARKASPTIPQ